MLNHPYFLTNGRFTPALNSAIADKAKYETFLSSFNNFFWGMKWQCAKQGRGTVGKFFLINFLLAFSRTFFKKCITQFWTSEKRQMLIFLLQIVRIFSVTLRSESILNFIPMTKSFGLHIVVKLLMATTKNKRAIEKPFLFIKTKKLVSNFFKRLLYRL